MVQLDGTPYWEDSSSMSRYPALDRDLDRRCRRDRRRDHRPDGGLPAEARRACRSPSSIAGAAAASTSDITTAHVTCVTDADLDRAGQELRTRSRAGGLGRRAGRHRRDRHHRDGEGIDCGWTWVPGYKHVRARRRPGDRRGSVCRKKPRWRPSSASKRHTSTRCPFVGRPGVAFDGQARFHPRKYLAALASCIDGDGSHIFEHTESEEVVRRAAVRSRRAATPSPADTSCIATHTPLMGKTNIAERDAAPDQAVSLHLVRVGGRVPKGAMPDALFWDTADPVPLPAHRSRIATTTSRSSAARITRPARRTTPRRASRARSATLEQLDPGLDDHAPLVRPGDRDQRRPAVHRRDRATPVRRDRLRRQRHDVRHARRR